MRAAFALFATVSACSGAPQAPVGLSNAAPEPAPARPPPPPPRASWPDFALAQSWPEAAPAVTALGHRRDGTLVRVRVEPSSLASYLALAAQSPMPDGARVAAFHEAPAGGLLGVYVLEKRAGSWNAVELDGQGARVEGDGSLCLRCHALAPTDHLFGVTSRAPGN